MSEFWLSDTVGLLKAYIRDDDVASIEQLVERQKGIGYDLKWFERDNLWGLCQESLAINATTYFFEQTDLFEAEDPDNPEICQFTNYEKLISPVALTSRQLLGATRSHPLGKYAIEYDWEAAQQQGLPIQRHTASFETLERLKAFIGCVIDHGGKFDEADAGLAPAMSILFMDDPSTLELASENGLCFGAWLEDPPRSFMFHYACSELLEGKFFDVIEFLLLRGYGRVFESNCVLDSGISKESIDWLADRGIAISCADLSQYSPVPLDLLQYALESGITMQAYIDSPESLWMEVISLDSLEYAQAFYDAGYLLPLEVTFVSFKSPEMIKWALSHGFSPANVEAAKYVYREESYRLFSSLIIEAAHYGVYPFIQMYSYGSSHPYELDPDLDEMRKLAFEQISKSLDYEVIKSCVDAGWAHLLDHSYAIESKNEEIIRLYKEAGVEIGGTFILDGTSYVRRDGDRLRIEIPEGILDIRHNAFSAEKLGIGDPDRVEVEISLPEGLTNIGDYAFAFLQVDRVVIPKSVKTVGVGSFLGARHITIYDTIDPGAQTAAAGSRDDALSANSNVGVMAASLGELPFEPVSIAKSFVSETKSFLKMASDVEITVLSSETNEVIDRVWMPLTMTPERLTSVLISSWGAFGSFYHCKADGRFNQLPNAYSKLRTSINRLLYPIAMTEEPRLKFMSYITEKNAKKIVQILCEYDDVDGLRRLNAISPFVTESNIKGLLRAAADSPRISEYLQSIG